MPIAILMPAFNEAGSLALTLGKVRDSAGSAGGIVVFLVDDGSEPAVDPRELPPPTPAFRIVLARHAVNLGQGAALETARQLALREAQTQADAYVTMDADGQHSVEDALALAHALREGEGADVAFGNRFAGRSTVPTSRRWVLFAARWFDRALTGLHLEDAHNGLRAFSRAALQLMPLHQNRMAHATEIKQRVSRARALRVVEVPVKVRYTKESIAKGQRALGAIDIVRDLLQQYLFGEHP